MKIKLKKQKKQLNEFVELLVGIAIAGAIMFIARKFFGPIIAPISAAATAIDRSAERMDETLREEGSPAAVTLADQLSRLKKQLSDKIKAFAEECKQVQKASELEEKPSVTLGLMIRKYETDVASLINSAKISDALREELNQFLEQQQQAADRLSNLDKLYLVASKKAPNGLYTELNRNQIITVMEGSNLNATSREYAVWNKFVELLLPHLELEEASTA